MTIRYTTGLTFEAVLLTSTENMMRVAIEGCDDVVEMNRIAETWVTDDCEPVQVEFAWSRQRAAEPVSEEDFICSHDLAAHLIHLLYAGDEETTAAAAPVGGLETADVYRRAVS